MEWVVAREDAQQEHSIEIAMDWRGQPAASWPRGQFSVQIGFRREVVRTDAERAAFVMAPLSRFLIRSPHDFRFQTSAFPFVIHNSGFALTAPVLCPPLATCHRSLFYGLDRCI